MDYPCNQSIEILTEKWEYDTPARTAAYFRQKMLYSRKMNELNKLE